jgi:hypothetical protein
MREAGSPTMLRGTHFLCQTMKLFHFSIVFLAFFDGAVFAAPKEDFVENLPGFGKPPTPHYSGYLDGTDGCDTKTNGAFCKLHYWYAEAEEGAADKPVVLWR